MSAFAQVVPLSARPDLAAAMWDMADDWPPFMKQDPVGDLLFGRLPEDFPDFQLVALDAAGRVVGKVNSIPFAWSGEDADLPARGWDAVLERGFGGRHRGTPPTAVSLLEARVDPALRGGGLSAVLLTAVREHVASLGFRDVVAPVRPTGKTAEPRTPMAEYVARVREDGLPVDPWLRQHVRLGARVVGVCPVAMTIPGTLEQWRAWTGLPLLESGEVEVPGALVPVLVQAEHGTAVYVEPNVWVHHRVG